MVQASRYRLLDYTVIRLFHCQVFNPAHRVLDRVDVRLEDVQDILNGVLGVQYLD